MTGFAFHFYGVNHVLEEPIGAVTFADSSQFFKYLIASMQFINLKTITVQFIKILITECYCFDDLCFGFVTLFAVSHVTDKGQVSII